MTRISTHHLTLLRHGESTGNAEGRWQGQKEFPLTERGRAQAAALAARWRVEGRVFDVIVASPLSRALDTACIIAEALGLTVETDPVWLERDNGVLAGTERDYEPEEDEIRHLYSPIGRSGETEAELHIRGSRGIAALLRRPPGRYLVVAHGGILNKAMAAALGIAPQANAAGARFSFGNTGFTTIEYQPERSLWVVHSVNDTLHLAGEPASNWRG